MQNDYLKFLKSKKVGVQATGFDVSESEINPMLFPFQNETTRWALKLGRAALLEECGMGKSAQFLEWSRHVAERTGKKVLILSPLAVAHQTVREGSKFGIKARYCRSQGEAIEMPEQIIVTNYDMLKEFDARYYAGVVIDESSILKSYTGQTKRYILEQFKDTPYKLACTATPAPNDHMELGNHSEFLNAMRSTEMLQRWFINNTMKVGNYRLKGHAEKDFWRWVTSWAVCISKPSDLGYSDEGFDLPPLNIEEHIVGVDHTRAHAEGQLFLFGALSATKMWKEKSETAMDRCLKAKEISTNDEALVIWCDTNDEADILKELFPDSVEVRGSDSIRSKEEKLNAFSDGNVRVIITKPEIAGFGLNWQHAHEMTFVGVTYSFEKFYQCLRREWRFGQQSKVNAKVIYAESEGSIIENLRRKQGDHRIMQQAMNEAMRENGLGMKDKLQVVDYKAGAKIKLPEWVKTHSDQYTQ